VKRILLQLDKGWFAAAIVAYWLPQIINSLRLQLIVRWLSPTTAGLPFRLVFRVVCTAGFIAVVAPIGLMADAAKVGALRLAGNQSLTNSARATLFDRVVAVQWMALFGFVGVAY